MKKSNTCNTIFVLDHDMRKIYRELYLQFPEGFPEFLLCDELPNGKEIMRTVLDDGRSVYYVKDNTDEVIISLLCKEFNNPQCEPSEAPVIIDPYHKLSDRQVGIACFFASCCANILNTELRQLLFGNTNDELIYTRILPNTVSDTNSAMLMFFDILQYIRMDWLYKNRPDLFDNSNIVKIAAYADYISEPVLDSFTYAIKFESIILGKDFHDNCEKTITNSTILNKVIQKSCDITINIPENAIHDLRTLAFYYNNK